jgi:3-dehydroquinate synthase
MVMAAALSARCNRIDPAFVPRLERVVERAGLPTRGPRLGAQRYLDLMRVDKKAEAGRIRFVLLDGPGRAGLFPVDDTLVGEVIEAYTA